MKKTKIRNFSGSSVLLVTIIFMLTGMKSNLMAQSGNWSLSVGGSLGLAPSLSYGSNEASGALLNLFGDLQYNKLIGQLEASFIIPGSVNNKNFNGGYGLYGSLGYNITAAPKLHIPLMLSGGSAVISYNNSYNGSQGNNFRDVSPQIGFVVSPYYEVNQIISIQAAFRYMKGFKGSSQSEAIDGSMISLGVRLRLL